MTIALLGASVAKNGTTWLHKNGVENGGTYDKK
jgi:hypothetical protein